MSSKSLLIGVSTSGTALHMCFTCLLEPITYHKPQSNWKQYLNTQGSLLENVEHCGGEPEQADTGYYVIDR